MLASWMPGNSHAQSGVFWYVDGIEDYWFIQPDVFAFRCINGQAFTGSLDSTIVDSIYHHATRQDQAVEVYFDPGSSLSERLDVIQDIFSSGQLEMPYITVTQDTLAPYEENEWFVIDNLLLVNFKVPYPDASDIAAFMSTYNLDLYAEPSSSLPLKTDSVSYTYVFEILLPGSAGGVSLEYFLDLAQDMIENQGHFVHNAEPNIVNYRVSSQEEATGLSYQGILSEDLNCPTNDPLYGEMNHIENVAYNVPYTQTGQYPSMPNGVAGADADICACWDQGYDGTGIKIGVIGSHDFCLNHPDLDNQFDPTLRWDCTSGTCTTLVGVNSGLLATSGMRMAGLIGAEANNQTGMVGVAPGTTIVPYKIGSNYASTFSLVAALQRALIDEVDVLVTDFFSPVYSVFVRDEMKNHFQLGRNLMGTKYGTVIIAPAGYTSNAIGSTADFHPAATVIFEQDVVYQPISVIGSNRFDQLCTEELVPQGASWQKYALPSHYGLQYDVAAPGPRMPAPNDLGGTAGAPTYTWDWRPHTGAVSTVAGIAAMLLEKNSNQTAMEVRGKIIQGVEQVGGYTYTGGKSVELGFGRVNCGNSLDLVATALAPGLPDAAFIVAHLNDCWRLRYDLPVPDASLSVCNLMGQTLQKMALSARSGETDLLHSHLSPGMYLIQLRDARGRLLASRKVRKY